MNTVNQITDTITIAKFEDGSLREIKVGFTLGLANILETPINPAIWDIAKSKEKPTLNNQTADTIIETVAAYYSIPIEAMKSKHKKREVVTARQMAIFFLTRKTKLSLKNIGLMFGGRDHTTALHSRDSIKDRVENDDLISADYYNLCVSLEAVPEYRRRFRKLETL